MKELIDKIESYLFDFLGLFIPGLISILIFTIPVTLLNFDKLFHNDYSQSKLLCLMVMIHQDLEHINILNDTIFIIVTVLILYLLGHLIKVLSIIMYECLALIFDFLIIERFQKLISKFIDKLNKVKKWYISKYVETKKHKLIASLLRFLYKYFKKVFKTIKNNLEKIFTFKPEDYYSFNKVLMENVENTINQKLEIKYPNDSYSMFKISTIIHTHENIKSLVYTFLAKYNLYRSLSFLFFISFIYYYYFFKIALNYIYPEILSLESIVLLFIFLMWFTFHYKYKRYWTLCGNEALVSLFYDLNKNKLNAG